MSSKAGNGKLEAESRLRVRRRKKREEDKLEFEAAKVFNPAEVKAEDFEIDLDSPQYWARKGPGGDRRA